MAAPALEGADAEATQQRLAPAQGQSADNPAQAPEQGVMGEIRVAAGRQVRLQPIGQASDLRDECALSVRHRPAPQEKEKLSITLDKSLVEQIRAHFGERALATSINDLRYVALAQERLGQLVDEMEQEAGQASPEA